MTIRPEDIDRMTYEEAVAALVAHPHTSYLLRQRIREDGNRELAPAMTEAELLVALLRARARHERGGQLA